MSNETFILDDNHVDDDVDIKIAECLNLENPKSFFLFAGAGSGKTRSLIKALDEIIANDEGLRLRGQKVAVITYTNNACDEIKRRLKNDKLVYISTIHSFVWNLIKGFNVDIKAWLEFDLKTDIVELESKSSRAGTKAESERLGKIESKNERLKELDNIKKFTYNPNSNNTEKDSLTHTEVLQLGAYFLTHKTLMQKILIKKFPILLIDESQDTNKELMEAFLLLQKEHKTNFSLGLLGDTMQRIYSDGKIDLGTNLPEDWEKPAKKMNHRSKSRIIDLINKTRSDVDTHIQQGRLDKTGGLVRLFIVPANIDKQNNEQSIMEQMAEITSDEKWNKRENIVSLILEHHMAANRMGFGEMFEALYKTEKYKTGLLDGTLPLIRIFSETIWPIIEAHTKNDQFAIANIVKNKSKLFEKKYMKEHKLDAKNILQKAKIHIETLCKSYVNNNDITFKELLQIVNDGGIFDIPREYKYILDHAIDIDEDDLDFVANATSEELATPDIIEEDNEDSVDNSGYLGDFLNTKFSQIREYNTYIGGNSPFFTHQSVKGLEFSRVMAIIDDSEARGFLFSYDKLFGIKDKTKNDLDNEAQGKETGIERTRRLFYVICSRAEESLAIVAYTSNPQALKTNLSGKGWFSEDEIIIIG